MKIAKIILCVVKFWYGPRMWLFEVQPGKQAPNKNNPPVES